VKVSVKNQGKCEKVLSIEVAAERIKSEYDKYYSEIAGDARVPGFRPGRAPRDVLAMHYGGDAREAVLRNLIQEATFEAIEKEKIEPIFHPTIQKVDFKDDQLLFEALVELRPEIKLGNYRNLRVKKELPALSPSRVEETVQKIRESYSKFIPIEDRGVAEGDFLVCDMDCAIEGRPVESRKDDWFEVDTKKAQSDLIQGLLGTAVGETRTVPVHFPEGFPVKEFAGKTGQFTVHVKEIKTRELPPLTDEWVEGLGEVKTVEEFKARVREDLLSQEEHSAETRFENALVEALLKDARLELPPAAVERRLHFLLDETKKRLQYQGESAESIEKRKDELRIELQPEAEKQLKVAFLFDEIAKIENLKADEKDLDKKYEEMAERAKVPLEKVRSYYSNSEEKRESMLTQIQSEKVLEFLKQNAQG